jgi:hypothetical protein
MLPYLAVGVITVPLSCVVVKSIESGLDLGPRTGVVVDCRVALRETLVPWKTTRIRTSLRPPSLSSLSSSHLVRFGYGLFEYHVQRIR